MSSEESSGSSMAEEVDCDKLRQVGNCRSVNSLVWAGFALTNFVTIAALYSVFNKQWSPVFQTASFLFLLAGAFFCAGWSLYETVGSAQRIRISEGTRWYHFRMRKPMNHPQIMNPRAVYIKQAERTSIIGAFVWLIGVSLLLWDLGMQIVAAAWFVTAIVAFFWALPRYHLWKEK